MIALQRGQMFFGKNHADMINKALGTNYSFLQSSSVELTSFGAPGAIAWFVFMDGSEHGYEDGWRWRNKLSISGDEIREYNVSSSKEQVIAKRNENGYHPYRLAFQIDPTGDGDKYCCKFVGAFAFLSFLKEDLTAIKYIKESDAFNLGEMGEFGKILDDKELFIKKMLLWHKPISAMGFSDRVYRLLKGGNINYAGELLETGLGASEAIFNEIRLGLYNCFGEQL